MKTVAILLASSVVIWWVVRPNSNVANVIGGFIADIIAYFQFLTGAPLIGSGNYTITPATTGS